MGGYGKGGSEIPDGSEILGGSQFYNTKGARGVQKKRDKGKQETGHAWTGRQEKESYSSCKGPEIKDEP